MDHNFFFNCSVPMNHIVAELFVNKTFEITNKTANRSNELSALVIIMLIAVFINIALHLSYCKRDVILKYSTIILTTKSIRRFVALIVLVLSLPIVLLLIGIALCYKILCTIVIWRKDKRFVGLLDSFDVFWSLEDEATINVLGIIEAESPETLVRNIKNKLVNIIRKVELNKIFYRRYEEYGFYYWRRYSCIDIDAYVEVLDYPEKKQLNIDDLEDIMSEVAYESLPYNNEGLFKIFVTKQRVGEQIGDKSEYGIIFIIHHSVGDGVALLDFLCKSFADSEESSSINMFAVPESRNYDSPTALVEMIQKLCEIPLCFVDTILRKPNENSLHGPTLLKAKFFKWTESDENLLLMVKEIKANLQDITFTDILATALSGGMRNYFTKNLDHMPEELGVILPIRFPKPQTCRDQQLLLKNDFSVTILDLPMKANLYAVKQRFEKLRKSADPLFNHYFIKLVSLFPKQILQKLLESSHATLVFSNLPGPGPLSICGGNTLKKLVFFVPHKGNTGLDVTALSYGGKLRFAASVDKVLIPEAQGLSAILEGMVEEIKHMHRQHVKT